MNRKVVTTLIFVAVVGGVLVTFTYLGSQDGPPAMTQGPHHKLRFDLKNELIGVETDPPVDLLKLPPITDKKAVETRINQGCTSCHAKLPEHHPPKTECIKCHRMSATATRTSPAPAGPAGPAGAPAAGAPADAGSS